MVIALLWTLISGLGLIDTLRHYFRFREERPELVRAYTIEVVQDVALLAIGRDDPAVRIGLAVLLFVGPVLLTVASINHYWSRRRL